MKKITAIVRPEKLEPLKEALFAAQVSGMTISQVQGCGKQHGWKEYYRGTEVMLNMIPKVKFELVVDDGEVGPLVDLIRINRHRSFNSCYRRHENQSCCQ